MLWQDWLLLYFGGYVIAILEIVMRKVGFTIENKRKWYLDVAYVVFWPTMLPLSFICLSCSVFYWGFYLHMKFFDWMDWKFHMHGKRIQLVHSDAEE